MVIAMTSWIFLMRILAGVGSDAVAGATIALRVMLFTLMPAWGLSNAAATLVGQNLGAGHPNRAEDSVWRIGFYNMLFLIGVSIVYFFYNESLMRIFTDDPLGNFNRRRVAPNPLLLLFCLWLVDGHHTGIQWFRRYAYSYTSKPFLLLATSDPFMLFPGFASELGTLRCLLGSFCL